MRNINSISNAMGGIDDAVKIDFDAFEREEKKKAAEEAKHKEALERMAKQKENLIAKFGAFDAPKSEKTQAEEFAERDAAIAAQKKKIEEMFGAFN